MLSILIPVYNFDIESLVTKLTLQLQDISYDYEIIILDDASTDTSIKIKNERLGVLKNCRYVTNNTNLGRTSSRQKLAYLAQYQYLLFLDADVLPKYDDFIARFSINSQLADMIFGGVEYLDKSYSKDNSLRWKYGKNREQKNQITRQKSPYLSIISMCFLIKKNVFLNVNTYHENLYGLDVFFSYQLEKLDVTIVHIDNPIFHTGLEENTKFLAKSKEAMETLHNLVSLKKIPDYYRPIQKASNVLMKYKLSLIYIRAMETFEKMVLKNLNSQNPSLFLFDLYRLYHYHKCFNK